MADVKDMANEDPSKCEQYWKQEKGRLPLGGARVWGHYGVHTEKEFLSFIELRIS